VGQTGVGQNHAGKVINRIFDVTSGGSVRVDAWMCVTEHGNAAQEHFDD
jgi:hypothetical protein